MGPLNQSAQLCEENKTTPQSYSSQRLLFHILVFASWWYSSAVLRVALVPRCRPKKAGWAREAAVLGMQGTAVQNPAVTLKVAAFSHSHFIGQSESHDQAAASEAESAISWDGP